MTALRPLVPLLLVLAASLAGCLAQDSDDGEDAGTTPTAPVWIAQYANDTKEGELAGMDPLLFDPQGGCVVAVEGEEGIHYHDYPMTPVNATSRLRLELAFTSPAPGAATPAASLPDLDMLLFDPDGNEMTECAGATTGNPEVINAVLRKPGEHTVRVVNFAAVQASYTLEISQEYAILANTTA